MSPISTLSLICGLSALSTSMAMPTVGKRAAEPAVVADLDLARYMGRWYQMYASPSTSVAAKCVTADYEILDSDNFLWVPSAGVRIRMHNRLQDAATGEGRDVNATATLVPSATTNNLVEGGKLSVALQGDQGGAGTTANYWVVAVGPKNALGDYDWAMVSNGDKSTLQVLARDQAAFGDKYGQAVVAQAEGLGFTGDTKPVATVHDATCKYPDVEKLLPDDVLRALEAAIAAWPSSSSIEGPSAAAAAAAL